MVPNTVHGVRADARRLLLLLLPSHHGARCGQSAASSTVKCPAWFASQLRLTSCAVFQANELLLSGRKLTAQEACLKGLVSQVLWPGTFTQEVMLRIKELVAVDSLVSSYLSFSHTHIHTFPWLRQASKQVMW